MTTPTQPVEPCGRKFGDPECCCYRHWPKHIFDGGDSDDCLPAAPKFTKETMCDQKVLDLIDWHKKDSRINQARQLVRFTPRENSRDPIDDRRREFETVRAILALYGIYNP